MTATSGPGISLMQEFIGLAYFAEIPSVFWDVNRVGPSTGLPTEHSNPIWPCFTKEAMVTRNTSSSFLNGRGVFRIWMASIRHFRTLSDTCVRSF